MQQSRFLIGVGVLLALAITTSASAVADPPSSAVGAVFADCDTTTTPGCSLGVIRDGELIYKRGYGLANLEYGIALSPRSVFRTGSVGKQFTAMAIALLAEAGTLSLDDPLSKYFPELPDFAAEITIRHLIHHTSGIRDYLTLAELSGLGDEAYYTDEFAIDLLARQRNLNHAPGEEHLYSNTGYFLMSHIVERVTHQSLREWAAANIFGPLGMQDSHFHDDHTHIVPNRADGYAPTEDGYRISMTTLDMVGDGGVYTTVEDLLLWDRNFLHNRLGEKVPTLIEQVTTPGELVDGEVLDYAFGLRIHQHRGLKTISHDGSFVGYRAAMLRFPEQCFSVVVLCNRSDAEPTERALQVAELYLADVITTEQGPTKSANGEVKGIDVPAEMLAGLAGRYWSPENRVIRQIESDEGTLFYVHGEDDREELVPLGGGRFAFSGRWSEAEVRFEPSDGDTHRMWVQVQDDEISGVYECFQPRIVSEEELSDYEGVFYSEELDVEYVLQVRDGGLAFGIGKPGGQVLEAQFGEIFSNPDYGTFEFDRRSEGAVVGFFVDSDGVRKLQFLRR